MLKRVLHIAVPNGLENGAFQLVKVAQTSVAALFGTYQIAAAGVAQSFWTMGAVGSIAMEPVFITVIGQCMGAGDTEQADYYFRKLIKITFALSISWNALTFALTPWLSSLYAISPEAQQLVIWLVLIHNVFSALVQPVNFPVAKGMRAAGDVKYTTAVAMFCTLGVRFCLTILLAVVLKMGVIGVALAMVSDWMTGAVLTMIRWRSGKWKRFKVI